jgi:hypothetical protein
MVTPENSIFTCAPVLIFCLSSKIIIYSTSCALIRGIFLFRQEGCRGKQEVGRCSGSLGRKPREMKHTKLPVDVSPGTISSISLSSCFFIDPSYLYAIHFECLGFCVLNTYVTQPIQFMISKSNVVKFLPITTNIDDSLIWCYH